LREGKVEEARAIFDRLVQSDQANVDRAAQDHFARASVFALQSRLDEALPDYAKAYQYRPDDPRYAEAYASALQRQKDYSKAESVLVSLLRQMQSSAGKDPAAYRPDLATTLNSLGSLYADMHRYSDAEAALKEAGVSWQGKTPSTGQISHEHSTTWEDFTWRRIALPTRRLPSKRPPTPT